MWIFNCSSIICWKYHILFTELHLYPFQKPIVLVCGSIYGFSLLFHWSIFVYWCQYHTVLVTVALWWVLKSDGVSPLTSFFWKTFLPSHQKTKLEWVWRVLVLVLCLVRDLRESLKATVLHPQPSLLSSSVCPGDTWNPRSQSVWIKWPCLVLLLESRNQCPRKRWSLGYSNHRGGHESPGIWLPLEAPCWIVINWPNHNIFWGVRIWNVDRAGVWEQWMATCERKLGPLVHNFHRDLLKMQIWAGHTPSSGLNLRSARLPLDVLEPLLCTLPFQTPIVWVNSSSMLSYFPDGKGTLSFLFNF